MVSFRCQMNQGTDAEISMLYMCRPERPHPVRLRPWLEKVWMEGLQLFLGCSIIKVSLRTLKHCQLI